MQLASTQTIILFIIVFQLLPLLLHAVRVDRSSILLKGLQHNATNVNTTSQWLRRVMNPRAIGCWSRPWICNVQGEFPPRIKRLCCKNRCVDVTSDVNNCGLCGIRCPFTWQCCRGLCIDTSINPFHCGSCERRCTFPSLCFYGMCGYAQPLPPFPFPFPPHPFPPRPPFPFPPHPFPFPPHPFPPLPFPPHLFPPKPFPPKPPQPPLVPHPPIGGSHPPDCSEPPPGPLPPYGPRPDPPMGGQPPRIS